jgi:hypothetical protein
VYSSSFKAAQQFQSTHNRLVEDIRAFYEWMTRADGVLFQRQWGFRTDRMRSSRLSDSRPETGDGHGTRQRGEVVRDHYAQFIVKKIGF